jgi:hypothetical protein
MYGGLSVLPRGPGQQQLHCTRAGSGGKLCAEVFCSCAGDDSDASAAPSYQNPPVLCHHVMEGVGA